MSYPTIRTVQQQIVDGEIRLTDLVANHLNVIKKRNPDINAVTYFHESASLQKAEIIEQKIKAGTVFVNTYGGSDNTLPLTGVKQSGNGSDKSLHALDKFTDLKSVWMKL